MGLKRYGILVLLVLLKIESTAMANWMGPQEVLSGAWGTSVGQFAIEYGDSGTDFPRLICVGSSGFIAIADRYNSRIQTYNSDGFLIAAFTPKNISESEGWKGSWPGRMGCLSGSVYAEFDRFTQIYGTDGSLIKSWDNLYGGFVSIMSNGNFVTATSSTYYIYSPTGQLVKTTPTRPLELGIVEEKSLSNAQYKVTVTFSDKVWSYVGAGVVPNYVRDTKGNLYGSGERQAIRWDLCGRELARLTMPKGYGSPVFAPNGDVYTWKRTPDKYSILKWTWVDDPNVPSGPDTPTGLSIMPSTTGLYLTWTASVQDPGCVTGYEVNRATTSGGVTTTVATVDKGVIKYNDATAAAGTTYFYKIRAVAGSEYSSYTSEVSGKR